MDKHAYAAGQRPPAVPEGAGASARGDIPGRESTALLLEKTEHLAAVQRYERLRRRFFALFLGEDPLPGETPDGCLRALRDMGSVFGGVSPAIHVPELPFALYFPSAPIGAKAAPGAGKSVLLVCPSLDGSETGAFAMRAALDFLRAGWFVTMGAVHDGPAREKLLAAGAQVAVSEEFARATDPFKLGQPENSGPAAMPGWFDLCVVLTAELYGLALHAGQSGVPVLWWLNDGRAELLRLSSLLPRRLAENITVCGSGPQVWDALAACGLRWDVQFFPVCVEEESPMADTPRPVDAPVVFTQLGDVRPRDGQDLLTEAIRRLPIQVLRKTRFYFAGPDADASYTRKLKDFCRAWPNADYLGEPSEPALTALLDQTDVLLFPGHDDPRTRTPARGLLRGRPCLCADTSGAAGLVRGEPDAFIFPAGDGDALLRCLMHAVENTAGLMHLGQREREACGQMFSGSSFARTLSVLAEQCLRSGSPGRSLSNG